MPSLTRGHKKHFKGSGFQKITFLQTTYFGQKWGDLDAQKKQKKFKIFPKKTKKSMFQKDFMWKFSDLFVGLRMD